MVSRLIAVENLAIIMSSNWFGIFRTYLMVLNIKSKSVDWRQVIRVLELAYLPRLNDGF